jgi:hypothetical protein
MIISGYLPGITGNYFLKNKKTTAIFTPGKALGAGFT